MKSKLFWWSCTVIWCGLIFYMSSQNANESSNQSLFIATLLNRLIKLALGPHAFALTEFQVRKTAHFLEFLVLGCLLFMGFLDRAKLGRSILLVFTAGIVFAVSDELHQHFIPGRTPLPFDVLIDTAGISAAVVIMYVRNRAEKTATIIS
jgi:VanZ family protein